MQRAEHHADYEDIDEQEPDRSRGREERLPAAHDEHNHEKQHEAVIFELVKEEPA